MVTVHDVARAAGVSGSTVSRALGAPDKVAPATREAVRVAAEKLGYRPNRAARGLRAGRTGALGLVVPDVENPYFASVIKGIQARAGERGYAVFVVDSEEDPEREAAETRSLAAQTDGVLLASSRVDDATLRAAALTTPMVLINRTLDDLPSVTVDLADGIMGLVAHLRALGHRRLVYLGGPATSWSDARRREGLRLAAEKHPDIEVIVLGPHRPDHGGGYSATDVALAEGGTAILAFNDLVAIGVLHRLHERGVDVPGTISVTGFDDTFVATLAVPALTNVRTDLRAVGRAAIDLLVHRVEASRETDEGAERGSTHVELPTELVVRSSTGPVPRA